MADGVKSSWGDLMRGTAHAFPEFPMNPPSRGNGPGDQFRLLCEELKATERQVLPTAQEDMGKKLQEVEKEAYLKGLKDGEVKGVELGKRHLEPLLETFSEALKELEVVKKELLGQAERASVRLAIALAEKIIHQEIRSDISVIMKMAEELLGRIKDHGQIILRLNPHDMRKLKEAGYDLRTRFRDVQRLSIKEDPEMESGDMVLETEFGELDARIQRQLEAMREALLGSPEQAGQ